MCKKIMGSMSAEWKAVRKDKCMDHLSHQLSSTKALGTQRGGVIVKMTHCSWIIYGVPLNSLIKNNCKTTTCHKHLKVKLPTRVCGYEVKP
jgi:hypothetical protein